MSKPNQKVKREPWAQSEQGRLARLFREYRGKQGARMAFDSMTDADCDALAEIALRAIW